MRFPRWQLRISERKTLLVLGDLLLVNAAVLIALWVWTLRAPRWTLSWGFILSHAHWFTILTALWLVTDYLNDFYSLKLTHSLRPIAVVLPKIATLVFLIYVVIYFFSLPRSLPRGIVLYHVVAASVLMGLWRAIYIVPLSRLLFQRRAIVVGAGRAGRTIVRAVQENPPVGFIDDNPAKQRESVEGLPVLGTSEELISLIEAFDISELSFRGR